MEGFGYCRFCGQSVNISTLEDIEQMTEDELIEQATLHCSCGAAKWHKKEIERKERAIRHVSTLFGEGAPKGKQFPEAVVGFLQEAVVLMCDGQMEKISMNIYDGVKAAMSLNSKGEIKIERQETRKQQLVE